MVCRAWYFAGRAWYVDCIRVSTVGVVMYVVGLCNRTRNSYYSKCHTHPPSLIRTQLKTSPPVHLSRLRPCALECLALRFVAPHLERTDPAAGTSQSLGSTSFQPVATPARPPADHPHARLPSMRSGAMTRRWCPDPTKACTAACHKLSGDAVWTSS